MSLTINIRPAGATSGGDTKTLPADGDNGNQEIDTKKEAEAALAFLPEGSKNVVNVGGRDYTREELIAIRDRKEDAAGAPANKIVGDGASHGFYLQGKVAGGLGDKGHGGGGAGVGYVAGFTLLNGPTRLFLDPNLGVVFGHYASAYKAPNGEAVDSNFTNYGASGGLSLRVVPNFADHRISFGAGPTVEFGGFSTADSKTVSLPKSCKAGDFGRGECEPNAGAKTGNAGTQGLMNFDLGSARGTSGAFVSPGASLNLAGDVLRGDWGNLQLTGSFNISRMILLPSDGHGFSYTQLAGLFGIRGNFGGGAVEKPAAAPLPPAPPPPPPADQDGDGVPDTEDKCPTVKGTKENKGCPDLEASVTSTPASVKPQEKFPVGISVKSDSKIDVSVSFKSADNIITFSNANVARKGDGTYPFEVPANLKSGKYKLIIDMEDMKTGVIKTETKEIVIVENVTADDPENFSPGQTPSIKGIRLKGQEKLEGVTYEVEGFDKKDGKSVGKIKSDKPITLLEKTTTKVSLEAPEKSGWRKDVRYVVNFMNKEGLVILTKEFLTGQTINNRRRGAK